MHTQPALTSAGSAGGTAQTAWGSFLTTGTSTVSPNIVWQGTTSGSSYTSANVALSGGGSAGGKTWHP